MENIYVNGRFFPPDFDLKFIGFIYFIKGLLIAQPVDQNSN